MKATFIETTGFTESIVDLLSDHAYALLQQALLKRPDAGKVMPGCNGLRKYRTPDPKRGKGKRGGVRVIYLHVPGLTVFTCSIFTIKTNRKISLQVRRNSCGHWRKS
jgi:hypothetical protein